MNAFNRSIASDTGVGARINRAITNGFSFAVVAMVGVMTATQYVAQISI